MNTESARGDQWNIGHICTRHQCERGLADKPAMLYVGPHGAQCRWTFAELDERSSRFAGVVTRLGFVPGDVLFLFLPRIPEVYSAFLGALKARLITGTLFSNFGEEALLDRLGDARAAVVVTRTSLLKKLSRIRDRLPALRLILLVDAPAHSAPDVLSLPALLADASPDFEVHPTTPDTPSVLHYTSGSTGKPKGVLHRHGSVALQRRTSEQILGLGPADTFWCTADPGWVTGTSYGIIGPWSLGVTQLHWGGGYDPAQWFELLQTHAVTVWYTAPTALRMLMREAPSLFAPFDLSALRAIYSVGEPLNPEVLGWGRRVLGQPIYDTWFQTETGSILISNRPGLPIKPGSMGKPVPGIDAAIVGADGAPLAEGTRGDLCVRPGWESMFIGYMNHPEGYATRFSHGWYRSGDTGWRDPDGYYWFAGRNDDVINTAGHLVSPFEVESALLEVDGVAESGVIGVPDDLLWEKIVAFVALKEGRHWDDALEMKARLHVSNRVSTMAAPREFRVLPRIPKNQSGKIMRRLLRAQYSGTDTGDTSTLESEHTGEIDP